MNIGRFIAEYETRFAPLNDHQRKGLSDVLNFIAADEKISDIRYAAYMLATTKHETANTFLPVAEFGRGKGRKYGVADPVTGNAYYGRGYVQLTWAGNYKAMSRIVDVDLYQDPDRAMEPEIAYRIMSYGMRNGSFTGVGLPKYINDQICDYVNARRIINGTDCADKIAKYATEFESILKECTQ